MSVTDRPAFDVPTSDIAVPPGQIVYVEEMVAESVAFRADRAVGSCESDSVRRRLSSAPDSLGRPDGRSTATGAG